jgi:hypothetical protein
MRLCGAKVAVPRPAPGVPTNTGPSQQKIRVTGPAGPISANPYLLAEILCWEGPHWLRALPAFSYRLSVGQRGSVITL